MAVSKPFLEVESKLLLQHELVKEKVNICKVRELCKSNAGLVAASGLRQKIWSLLLLGECQRENAMSDDVYNSPASPCREQQVLEADVPRTRGDIEEFRSKLWRKNMTDILQSFCIKHNVQYKQGMNEILAPFFYLTSPAINSKIAFDLFEAFIFRYLERYFCFDDSSYLCRAFRLFHLLLLYHDPQLANHLHDNGFIPELYSPAWFLTLYSRTLPINHVLRLWDFVIAVDDPAFTFFIGLCLLRRLRDEFLHADVAIIPEIFKKLQFNGEDDIDQIVSEAFALYKSTPRSFCRNLRLCCVGTAELTPLPGLPSSSKYSGVRDEIFNKNIAIQATRSCLMLSPHELVSTMDPNSIPNLSRKSSHEMTYDTFNSTSNSVSTEEDLVDDETNSDASPIVTQINEYSRQQCTDISSSSSSISIQFVLIDIRPIVDNELSGGGIIPRAMALDPDFLDQPDAFDRWVQHFDGTRGCNICIIDHPPGQASSLSLWRRLILGEGDGFSTQGNNVSYNNTASTSSIPFFNNRLSTSSDINGHYNTTDLDSHYEELESKVRDEEYMRPSIRLARELQKASFPHVSVLDGGFPGLVDYLNESRGTVEPTIINHDDIAWRQYVKSTGRENYNLSSSAPLKSIKNIISSPSSLGGNSSSDHGNPDGNQIKTRKNLSELEIFEMGLQMALKMGHQFTSTELAKKIKSLTS